MPMHASLSRRKLLVSASGVCLPLPFLPSLNGCKQAAEPGHHPLIVVRAGSGVAQEDGTEPELFWPRTLGSLSAASLQSENADRVLSELHAYADRMLLVRGTQFPFASTHESHAGGGNQLLTATPPGPPTTTVMTYATGESIDNYVARQFDTNGGEPLTLYAGRRDNYGEEVLSYRGPLQLRGAESDPWQVYRRLIGADGRAKLQASVNDLVLDQLAALRASARISGDDLARLDQHTDSVREFEVLSERLSDDIAAAMKEIDGKSAMDDYSLRVAELHCDLIALVLACGQARAATLQIGDRLDNAKYTINGQTLPSFHTLSHRTVSDEELGQFATIPEMHAAVNRLHIGVFRYLLERLDERDLLNQSTAVFTSDVATGSHRYDQIPWVIVGKGDGALRMGTYVDAGGVTHDRVLAALISATGLRDENDQTIKRFGDASLSGGVIEGMLA